MLSKKTNEIPDVLKKLKMYLFWLSVVAFSNIIKAIFYWIIYSSLFKRIKKLSGNLKK